MVPLTISRTFLYMNDVCMIRFACKAWYKLNDEYTSVLHNDLPYKDAYRYICNTVND